ncbi:MAG: hypothetical protein ACREHE_00855 [Rhizomicrobium sp.]
MNTIKLSALAATVVLSASACVSRAAPIAEPSAREIGQLLDANGIKGVLARQVTAYGDGKPHWELEVYYSGENIASGVCLANVKVMEIGQQHGTYSVLEDGHPRRKVALQSCEEVASDGSTFASVPKELTTDQLARALEAVSMVITSNGRSGFYQTRFESADLRALLPTVRMKDLDHVDASVSDISVIFFVKELRPETLGFRVSTSSDKPEIYVYRENGPDIEPTR